MSAGHPTRRRLAAFAAFIFGIGLVTTGMSLLAASSASGTPQNPAPHKVLVCHATDSDTNPYVPIRVDVASVAFQGHLAQRDNPNKVWKTAGTFNGIPHVAGQPKPEIIHSYTDNAGVFHLLDGNFSPSFCRGRGTVTTTGSTTTTGNTTTGATTTGRSTTGELPPGLVRAGGPTTGVVPPTIVHAGQDGTSGDPMHEWGLGLALGGGVLMSGAALIEGWRRSQK